jgi:hypothetical protein
LRFTPTVVESYSTPSLPRSKKVDDLVKDPADAAKKLRLLWVSCGDRDNLMRISRGFHDALSAEESAACLVRRSGRT